MLQEKTVRFIDNLPGEYEILEGVKLYKTPSIGKRNLPSLDSDAYRQLPLTERDQTADNILADRVSRILSSYTLQFKVPESTVGEMNNSMEEG